MGDWGASGGALSATIGQTAASSTGTTLTAGGSANTKGAWAQLSAATPIDATGIIVVLGGAVDNGDFLVDIGIGASGVETIIVPDVLHCGRAHDFNGYYPFPICVPRGSRVVARCQATGASLTLAAQVILLSGGFSTPPGGGRVAAYGTAAADSGGTQVTPSTNANEKGAWSELVGSTGGRARQILVSFGNMDNNVRTSAGWLIDVGIGPAGQEHIILADLNLAVDAVGDLIVPPVLGPFPITVPAGSRIAARAQCSITNATDKLFDIAVYGVG